MARRRPADPMAQALRPGQYLTPWQAGQSTTQRGLGWDHQQQRKRLLKATPEGWPCPLCGLPMLPKSQPATVDADHSTPRSLGGTRADRLAHSSCNRSRGNGTRTAAPARAKPAPPTVGRDAGQPITPQVTTRRW